MYWYPYSREEEDRAWGQANAQSEEYSGESWNGAAKFIGNLGELAINSFFEEFVPEGAWNYYNSDAMENREPEFNDNDFELVDLEIDVKTTVDVRKFSPMYAYESDGDKYGLGAAEDGFPKIDPGSNTDVFIFVVVTKPDSLSPIPYSAVDAKGWAINDEEDRDGDYIAIILGWMFSEEFTGDAIGNLIQVKGKFSRLHVRDLYELLIRSGVNINST